MRKVFKNTSKMIATLSESKKFASDTINQLKIKRLAKFLFLNRCAQNLTQKELAKKVGCSTSKISKIEHSNDEDLTIKDLLLYSNVLNMHLKLNFSNGHFEIKVVK